MVQIYQKRWERNTIKSFLGYLRDTLVFFLPVRKLPKFLRRMLYGLPIRFAFIVHPRSYQDVYIAAPFLKPLKLIFRKNTTFEVLTKFPSFVTNYVHTAQGVEGVVVGQLTTPQVMLKRRKLSLKVLRRTIEFISKIAEDGAVVGLGGWFPIISNRGEALEEKATSLGLTITNGHCGTLASIYMTVHKLGALIGLDIKDIKIAVVGTGKMGTNVVRAFNGIVRQIFLIDINDRIIDKVIERISEPPTETQIGKCIFMSENIKDVRDILNKCHIGVFATSNLRNLLKIRDLPLGFIAIDDARPEAIPRDPKNERIILEGGLLKVNGAKIDYNYGFGEDDNVFGCLGEALLLAIRNDGYLKPTIGDVDMENFQRFLAVCRELNISEGDFKSTDRYVSNTEIQTAFSMRKLPLESHTHK